jgi:hypothetical protein
MAGILANMLLTQGVPMGIYDSIAQKKRSEGICEQTQAMKQKYNNFYNSAVDALNSQTIASMGVQQKITNLRAEVTQTAQNLEDIQNQYKKSRVFMNIGLAISLIITAVMLYLKHKGMLTLNPLADS